MLTKEIMEAVMEFFWQADREDFVEVFGERLGFHLWGKYVGWDMDALRFAAYLDSGRFEQLVDAINASHFGDRADKRRAVRPTPKGLVRIVAEHGNDLLEWPTAARAWLVASDDAGEWVGEHAPGFRDMLADAVGQWHHMAFLGLAERDGSYEYFPF
jgi:catechol 2,3-dioxygenase-like lactoylglutathione lyase family enzyme